QVVVVGFGTQKKKDLTGSIASISSEDLNGVATTNFQQAIQGKIPGVVVQGTSGRPGATPQIRVRGTGSITAGNNPLYVVDGLALPDNVGLQGTIFKRRDSFQPHNSSSLSGLSSNGIESINVL